MFAAALTTLTSLFCRQILELMRTPENIIDEAYTYILIIFWGIPTVFLYNILSGVIRALGDSKTPVIFLVMSSFINIGLDLYFIMGLHMGVAGAALATVISQGVSGVACLFFMIRKFEILRIRKGEWVYDPHKARTLCGMGVPMGLQYSITAIGSVILQSATNTLGSDAVAAMTAAQRINGFMACPFDALGSTMATYVRADGTRGDYLEKFAQVFRREGELCNRCGAEIVKTRVAGRGTHICPRCQQ